jgi:hypothetical protein
MAKIISPALPLEKFSDLKAGVPDLLRQETQARSTNITAKQLIFFMLQKFIFLLIYI